MLEMEKTILIRADQHLYYIMHNFINLSTYQLRTALNAFTVKYQFITLQSDDAGKLMIFLYLWTYCHIRFWNTGIKLDVEWAILTDYKNLMMPALSACSQK